MSDLLSAASLLLAVASVLFGLWYTEISSALTVSTPTGDRTKVRRQIRNALYGRALPLTVVTVSISLVFLPDAVIIMKNSADTIIQHRFESWRFYNAVWAAFCLVAILLLLLATYSLFLVCALRNKLVRIGSN